ncbi:hypothetical protein [Caballeronia sp. SL2Y3]|uniref:hypothetical protein n=1 Tax=Caballeronia sp. SL2Y3 TaxID=2878151 RepID=UPI001FD2EADE|nr:hypothetical protein [Caballeronia sp. SL2Y3]
MSYHRMSNREGNQRRIMEMHEANMSPLAIATYMTKWQVPMTSEDVQGIINTYEPMGERAVKKSDVHLAIETHKRYVEPLNEHQQIIEDYEGSESTFVHHDFDENEEI